jgi:hypothetical protein
MSSREKIIYQNKQWKLLFWENTHFIEAKYPYPYWRNAKELRFDRHMIEHIAEKNWCEVEHLIDVAVKAIRMLGITPEYDINYSAEKARALSTRNIKLSSPTNKGKWLLPSEIEDMSL